MESTASAVPEYVEDDVDLPSQVSETRSQTQASPPVTKKKRSTFPGGYSSESNNSKPKKGKDIDAKVHALLRLSTSEYGYLELFRQELDKNNIQVPSVTVEFRHLTASTFAYVGADAIPTVLSVPAQTGKAIFQRPETYKQEVTLLRGISGVLNPGQMTLLLGMPGSGKSTLMRAVAGVRSRRGVQVNGEVLYNGHEASDFCVSTTAVYIDQVDRFIPSLTVRETLLYARTCALGRSIRRDYSLARQLSAARQIEGQVNSSSQEDICSLMMDVWDTELLVDAIILSLGLGSMAHMRVGQDREVGITYAGRRVLSVAEALVCGRRLIVGDDMGASLDGRELRRVIRFIRQATTALDLNTVIHLHQPGPSVADLFDSLLILANGHIVYHGPREGALPFFGFMGFRCPPGSDYTTFLMDVLTVEGQQKLATPDRLLSDLLLSQRATNELLVQHESMAVLYWSKSPEGQLMSQQLAEGYPKGQSHPAALSVHKYALSSTEALRMALWLQLIIMFRGVLLLVGRLTQAVVLGLFLGGLFFDSTVTFQGAREIYGGIYLALSWTLYAGMLLVPLISRQRRLFSKHREYGFYSAITQISAVAIAQAIDTVIEVELFINSFYWMIGLHESVGRYFCQTVILLATHFAATLFYIFCATLIHSQVYATVVASVIISLVRSFMGFTALAVRLSGLANALQVANPCYYAFRASATLEFTSSIWESTTLGNETASEAALQLFNIDPDQAHLPWNYLIETVIIMVVLAVLFIILSMVALAYIWPSDRSAQVSDPKVLAQARIAAAQRQHQLLVATVNQKEEQTALSRASRSESEFDDSDDDVGGAEAGGRRAQPGEAVQPGGAAIYDAARDALAASLEPLMKRVPVGGKGEGIRVPLLGVDESAGSMPKYPAITLVWSDINYVLHPRSKSHEVMLTGVSGFVEPGTMVALMGAAGAGKTTLLDVLAGRSMDGLMTGIVRVNGHERKMETWKRVVGYSHRTDVHSPGQTVKEALVLSARLRLPPGATDLQVLCHVDSVLNTVGLMDYAHDLVGYENGPGLTIDRRRRLTLAVELAARPAVLLADEPMAGLASASGTGESGRGVLTALRGCALDGTAVLVAVYRPNIDLLRLYDMVLLIQAGHMLYFGSTAGFTEFMEMAPGGEPPPLGIDPVEWVLEISSSEREAVVLEMADHFKSSTLGIANAARGNALIERDRYEKPELTEEETRQRPFSKQLIQLIIKFMHVYWRSAPYNLTRIIVVIIADIIYGIVYFQAAQLPANPDVRNVQTVLGLFFSSTTLLGMANVMGALKLLNTERAVATREAQESGAYNVMAYGVALSVVEAPWLLLQMVLFAVLFFPLVGLNARSGLFFLFFFVYLFGLFFYTASAHIVIAVMPTQAGAQVLVGALKTFVDLFSGFVVPMGSISLGWRWISYILPTTYIQYGLSAGQLGRDTDDLTVYGTTVPVNTFLREEYLYRYGFAWWTLLILAGWVAVLRMFAVLLPRYTPIKQSD